MCKLDDANRAAVCGERAIGGQKVKRFAERLRNQQPIEGIRGMRGKVGERDGVTRAHGKFQKAARLDRVGENPDVIVDFPQGGLDRNFPDRCG